MAGRGGLSVQCPAGKIAVGAGYFRNEVTVIGVHRNSPTMWTIATRVDSRASQLEAWLICVDGS